MNRDELAKLLIKQGINENLYNLTGIGRMDEKLCLECNSGVWEINFYERGIKTTNLKFDTEKEACQYMYDMLTN